MKVKFYLICKFLCVSFLIKAQQNINLVLAMQKETIGNYIEANVLYERVLFDDNNEENLMQGIKGKARCLKKINAFAKASDFLKQNINLISTDSNKCKIFEDLIVCAYLSNNLNEAISLINQITISYPRYINKNKLTLLHILSLNEEMKWQEAIAIYKQWLLTEKKDMTTAINTYSNIPKLKSKNKASWLSTFIPGGGAFYAKKPMEAIASIILQSAGVAYGFFCFNTGYYISTFLVGGGMAGSFHNGGVRRSEELINEYNKKVAVVFNENLKKEILLIFQ